MERRGRMYDPLVVDKFVTAKDELSEAIAVAAVAPEPLNNVEDLITASHGTSITIPSESVHRTPVFQVELQHAVRTVLATISKETSSLLSIVYLKDPLHDQLIAVDAIGMHAAGVLGNIVPLGSRVSGWVAANGQAIINTDCRLELSASIGVGRNNLCTALPIRSSASIAGVLLVTRNEGQPFDSDEITLLERICLKFDEPPLKELMLNASTPLKSSGSGKRPSIH